MVRDAMAGDRLIGMVLLRGDWRRDYHGSPPIFPVGCAGRIESFDLLPDGRSNIVLHGRASFEVVEEVPGKPYRRGRVRWRDESAGTMPSEAKRRRLRATVTRLLERGDRPVPDDLWERLPSDPAELVNALGFALDFGVIEKLSLLECPEVGTRIDRLLEIAEFRLAEQGVRIPGSRGEEPWH
jgi:hypothetical protein